MRCATLGTNRGVVRGEGTYVGGERASWEVRVHIWEVTEQIWEVTVGMWEVAVQELRGGCTGT